MHYVLKRIVHVLFFCILWSANSFAITEVRTIGPQKAHDASHQYFVDLLTYALGENYTIILEPHPGQDRAISLMVEADFYDVVWTGANEERDSTMVRVDFPLFLGGLGVRGAVIKRQYENEFIQKKTLADLKNVRFCLGHNWPDMTMFKDANLTVYGAVHFDSILKMVSLGRCDAFPLSIFEGKAELAIMASEFPDLIFNTQVLLRYPLNMYFYVNKKKAFLASSIYEGLTKMKMEGKYLHYMQQQPLTKEAFPLNQFKTSAMIDLKLGNDFLSN